MMAERARLRWLSPLLVLIVMAVIALVVATGVARGETTTTLTASPADPGYTDAGTLTAAGDPTVLEAFTVRADELGVPPSEAPSIVSPAAVVINADTGQILYEWDAHRRRPMASTTKIMTAILVLENLSLDEEVTVSAKAAQTPEPKALLREGDVVTIETLMYALLIRSSNGAAVALAEACDGSVDAFVVRMNQMADELGMEDTNFMNPNGLDADGHYSTAADMAKVARYAMGNERFREFVNTRTYDLELPGRTVELENTNKLLERVDWVTGIKTGLTPNAEQCLVAAATRDGVSVISVLLGQPVSEVCWQESETLLDYGLRQFKHVTFLEEGTVVAESEVPYQVDGSVRLITGTSLETDVYKEQEVTAAVRLDRPLTLPVQAGEAYGAVVLSVDGQEVGSAALIADRSFAETTLGSKIAYLWKRFTGWFS